MQIRHGALLIDIPGDWRDQSTLLFVAPTDPSAAARPGMQPPTEAVSVSFVATDSDPEALLDAQAEAMGRVDRTFKVIERQPFTCGLGSGVAFLQTLTLVDTPVQQLCVACRVDTIVVLATASAHAGRYDKVRAQLGDILASVRLARPSAADSGSAATAKDQP